MPTFVPYHAPDVPSRKLHETRFQLAADLATALPTFIEPNIPTNIAELVLPKSPAVVYRFDLSVDAGEGSRY